MHASRRAAQNGATPALVTAFRFAIAALGGALALVLTSMSLLSLRVARQVITPADRRPDTRLLDLDTQAQTVTLQRTADTVLPGRYGLFTTGTESYVKVGTVLSADDETVTRKLLTHVGSGAHLAPDAAFSGWYFSHPDELHLDWTPELVGSAVGPCPAWRFPAGDGTTWVVQVHGRGTTRSEALRAVPVFHALGITSLVVSYRNDGEAPRSRTGTYALGATEWRDVDAAKVAGTITARLARLTAAYRKAYYNSTSGRYGDSAAQISHGGFVQPNIQTSNSMALWLGFNILFNYYCCSRTNPGTHDSPEYQRLVSEARAEGKINEEGAAPTSSDDSSESDSDEDASATSSDDDDEAPKRKKGNAAKKPVSKKQKA